MIEIIPAAERTPCLQSAGLPPQECRAYLQAWDAHQAVQGPAAGSGAVSLNAELQQVQAICRQGRELLGRLPLKSKRSPQEKAAGQALVHLTADATWRFLARHKAALYRELTQEGRRPLRVEELAWAAAARLPGVLPSQAELAVESQHLQMNKDGLEIHQGLFFSQMLSDPAIGTHLLRAMMQPTPQALERLEEFKRSGQVDLGTVQVEARGQAGYVHFRNLRYLNAEDENTLLPWEMAVDLVLLHPDLRMGVLRGDTVEHPKYKGRRIFSAGINLTRIYKGQQSYLYYLMRDLGFGNKVYRGLLPRDGAGLAAPGDEPEATLEKPWVAAVEGFAIGGGCQLLLIVDYVIAEAGSYFNLPARK
ncbi:MAG TPA: enoyl-CoA hydratase-related protein, partial [bacterium]|nr:enoyl-CoA hydratase-related protein [bacterium]